MTGTLRVTPEKLKSTAQDFATAAWRVQNATTFMLDTIKSLNNSWAGEAATAYYNKANSLQPSIHKLVRMINEHSTDLQAMAQNYQAAENAAKAKASALKTDVIV